MTRSVEEILGDLLHTVSRGRKSESPLPRIRSHHRDGVLYVRADDLADALEAQAPEVNARLIAKLRRSA